MAVTSTAEKTRSLEFMPTWALATVTALFVVTSFVVERSLHWLGNVLPLILNIDSHNACGVAVWGNQFILWTQYLHKKKRKSMYHALQKMKDELMLVGFISLTLGILQEPISKICIKSSMFQNWSPCKTVPYQDQGTQKFQMPRPSDFSSVVEQHARRRLLAAAETSFACPEGSETFVSYDSLHKLHIFIFVLAATHVLYTLITMALALLKVYSWKKWESEARTTTSPIGMAELVVNNITYTRQSTFMRYHTSKPWSSSRAIVWVVSFFQQFYIPRADYFTLRFSFITTHNLPLDYNFHDYMMRSMEEEFETIVGISAWLWVFAIGLLLFNVQGVNFYFWMSFIPVVVIAAIGTKLQHVVATLAMESSGALPFPSPFMGAQLKPRDELFWFRRPKLLIYVIHLVLFQDAFEMSMFIWEVWQFGLRSCLVEESKAFFYTRLSLGLFMQLIVSFCTWPLYALVSQMGSSYKKGVIPKRVNQVLQVWHKDAKKRLKQRDRKASKEDLMLAQPGSAYDHDMNVSTPMTVAMEEGSEKRRENPWDLTGDEPQSSNQSVAIAAQNVWERRLRQTKSGRSKSPLHLIHAEEGTKSRSGQLYHLGASPASISTPGTELRHRGYPNDAAAPQVALPSRPPFQSSNTPK